MKTLIISTLLLFASFTAINAQKKNADFICILTTDKRIYKVGQIPKIEVRIINKTKHETYLIGSLNGSAFKERMPYCYFTIDKPKPDTINFQRCRINNPIKIEDFVLVKPEEKFNPFQSIDEYGFWSDYETTQRETFRNAGLYKLQFHYSTNTNKSENFIGNFGQWRNGADSLKIKRILGRVPKIDLVSNRIEIKFEN